MRWISLLFGLSLTFSCFAANPSALVLQQGHSEEILFLSVDPLGRTYATASRDKTVKVWDLRSGKLIKTVTGFSFYVTKVGYSPEGGFLYIRGDLGTCKVLSTTDFEDVTSKFYDDLFPITQVTFGVNDDMLLFGVNGSAYLVHTRTWKKYIIPSRVGGEVDHLAFDPSTKKATVRAKNGSPAEVDVSSILSKEDFALTRIPSDKYPYKGELKEGQVEIYDKAGNLLAKRSQPRISVPVQAVMSPDGQYIAVTFEDMPDMMLWSLQTNAMVRISLGKENCRAMYFSSEGKTIVVGVGQHLKVFDVDGNFRENLFSTQGNITALGVTSDRKMIVTGTDNGILTLYDAVKKQVLISQQAGDVITDLSVHPKGKQVAVAENGKVVIYKLPGLKKDIIAIKGTGTRSAAYSGDGKFLVAQDAKTKRVMIYESGKEEPAKSLRDPSEHRTKSEAAIRKQLFPVAFSNNGKYLVSMGEEWVVHLRSLPDYSIYELNVHSSWANSFSFSKNDKYLLSTSEDGSVRMWDVEKKQLLGTMVFNASDYVIATNSNFYMTSKGGYALVGFYFQGRVFPFEQYDVLLNRPDEVIKTFGSSNADLIRALQQLAEKRKEKMGFSGQQTPGLPPDIEIIGKDKIGLKSSSSELKLSVKAGSSKSGISRLLIWNNGVPVFGRNGVGVKGSPAEYKKDLSIPLVNGTNVIDVAAMDASGVESSRDRVITDFLPAKSNLPVLYFAGIGSSKFKQSAFDLKFPAKDVQDLLGVINAKKGNQFSEVKSLLFTDEKVEKGILNELKTFFRSAGRNDVVILCFAGHGVLSSSFDYYLSSYSIDFTNPASGGIAYSDFENLLDSIQPQRKLLLVDACHSGESDKNELISGEKQEKEVASNVSFRSVGQGVAVKGSLGLRTSTELVKELFADVRRGTGATIISSAGAAEFALESGEWKNGLFTYCVLEALKTASCDRNSDGKIGVNELLVHVMEKVSQLSGGKQHPTSRSENVTLDFVLW